jgi:hypothetical protein
MFSNIWKHPKTSVTGVLLATGTIVGVLSQQGITLGNAGKGTIVALIGGLATAFLGLLARDPESSVSAVVGGTGKAAVLALLCMTLIFAPVIGCTQAQRVDVAQEIVNWTPALESSIDTAASVVDLLDPVAAPIVNTLVTGVNALAPQFEAAAKAYLANPTQTALQTVQGLIVQIQNSVNNSLALLDAAKVTNPASQAKAKSVINGIATVANSLLALIEGVSTKAQVAAMSQNVTVHLAQVRGMLDEQQLQLAAVRIAADTHTEPVSVDRYFAVQARLGF